MKKVFCTATILIFVIVIYIYGLSVHNFAFAQELRKQNIPDWNDIDIAKATQRRIEADNLHYKDRIFGNPFRGLAMSIAPVKDKYEIGDNIEISVLVKNFSQEEAILYRVSNSKILEDFQYLLYLSDGNSVPKSDSAKKLEVDLENRQRSNLPATGSYSTSSTLPEEILIYTRSISPFFKIEKEGTYFLIALRRVTNSWQDGFMISNMTKINIVGKKEK
jgi:hypothetical protein